MTGCGLLDVSGAQYPILKLNSMSRKILKGQERVELICPEGFAPETPESPETLEMPEMPETDHSPEHAISVGTKMINPKSCGISRRRN